MNRTFKALLLITSLTTSIASAAVTNIAVDNFEDALGNIILDSNDDALSSTNSAFFLGTFNEATLLSADTIQELYAGFTLFDEIRTDLDEHPALPENDGFFSGIATADITPFDGQAIYIFIINSTTIGNATEALIWKLDTQLFDDDPNPFNIQPDAISLIASNGTAVFGVDAENNEDPYQLLPIPEPSGLALLGLGAVATLLRRRR